MATSSSVSSVFLHGRVDAFILLRFYRDILFRGVFHHPRQRHLFPSCYRSQTSVKIARGAHRCSRRTSSLRPNFAFHSAPCLCQTSRTSQMCTTLHHLIYQGHGLFLEKQPISVTTLTLLHPDRRFPPHVSLNSRLAQVFGPWQTMAFNPPVPHGPCQESIRCGSD